MQVSRNSALSLLVSALLFAGCGESEQPSTDAAETEGGANVASDGASNNGPVDPFATVTDEEILAAVQVPAEKSQTPKLVVQRFLEAVRQGEDGAGSLGEALLTHKAIVANKRADSEFAPPGNPNAVFEVKEQEILEDGVTAHVWTHWTDEFGSETSGMDIIWALRNEPNVGWGVAGAIFQPFPELEPVALDFEDPINFRETLVWMEQESLRRIREAKLNTNPTINREPPIQQNGGLQNGAGNGQPPINGTGGTGQLPNNGTGGVINNGAFQ